MLPGISGNLLPLQYVATHLCTNAPAHLGTSAPVHPSHAHFARYWKRVEATCGPATGLRTITDVAAMPLMADLGFNASSAEFGSRVARFQLRAAPGAQPVGLIVAPWANRSPAIWRDAVDHAHSVGAEWCVVFAPPALQIVDARAHWSRQFIEFSLADAAQNPDTFTRLAALAAARVLSASGDLSLRRTVAHAAAFQDAVRADLQHGVADSLAALHALRLGPGESLAIVYRVLFLLFVESRDLIPWRHPLYRPAYSIGTLCEAARQSPRATGLWEGLAAVSRLLRSGCHTPRLDVPPFNGRLFARSAAPTLERRRSGGARGAPREDAAIGTTLVSLSTRRTRHGRETIAYPDLGVEQLGAVYERVLGLPDRKDSGTFYTPRALTEFVVRTTLTPLTHNASADQILTLKVLDPSMGSGAFLVAACRHLAAAYERALVNEHRLSEHEVDDDARADFRRLVAQRCLYGVDKNPTAVELARLSLWLATLSRGKPLSFLDHRLRAGDALVGAAPEDLRRVADRQQRSRSPLPLLDLDGDLEPAAGRTVAFLREFDATADDNVKVVRQKEAMWSRLAGESSGLHRWRLASDLWCLRWFSPTSAPSAPELRAAIDALIRNDGTLPAGPLTRWLHDARAARDARGFFHWPLEFSDAFFDADGRPRPHPGFDAVVGNPPWEMLRAGGGAGAAGLARFIRDSGIYSSCGRGHINLYQPFLERALDLTRRGGRVGLVLPWGLASDDGAKALRERLLDRCETSAITGFDNRNAIFPIHRGVRFLALHASPGAATQAMKLTGGVTSVGDVDRPGIGVTASLLARVGGRARRIPDLRELSDLALLDRLSARFPPVGSRESYGASFGRELNVTDDRHRFGERGLPVIEGKHIQPFACDAASARFRITSSAAVRALPDRPFDQARLAYRDISAVGNRHALIAAIVPAGVVTTHTIFCLKTPLPIEQQQFLCACFNSEILNRFVRLLMGGHLTTSLVEGLPIPRWTGSARQRRIARLAARMRAPAHPSTRRTRALAHLLTREFETY
ncbi:MAG: hypothetical protein EPO35_08585 [Acidobacteria bacterium]|nr:MAG: hypothetical protein EPO35_08585 [Acidobacteriota bacterium]